MAKIRFLKIRDLDEKYEQLRARKAEYMKYAPRGVAKFTGMALTAMIVGVLGSTAFPLSYLLDYLPWRSGAVAPQNATALAAVTMIIPSLVISATAVKQWFLFSTEGFESAQKVLLWGGAVGGLVMFTAWSKLTPGAQLAAIGGVFLICLGGAGVLLEPVITWGKRRDAIEAAVAAQKALRRDLEDALPRCRDAETPAIGAPLVQRKRWWQRRLSRVR